MTLSAPRGSLRVSFQRSLRSGVPLPLLRRPHDRYALGSLRRGHTRIYVRSWMQ